MEKNNENIYVSVMHFHFEMHLNYDKHKTSDLVPKDIMHFILKSIR